MFGVQLKSRFAIRLRLGILAELREGLDHLRRAPDPAVAHRLAGSAAVLGLAELHHGFIALERALSSGQMTGQIDADLHKLLQMIDNYAREPRPDASDPRRQGARSP